MLASLALLIAVATQAGPAGTVPMGPKPPKPLSAKQVPDLTKQQQLKTMKQLFAAEITEDQIRQPITLGPRTPWIDEHTWLASYNQWLWETLSNQILLNSSKYSDAEVYLRFRAASGLSYFIDCKVSIDYQIEKLPVKVATKSPGPRGWDDAGTLIFDSAVLVKQSHTRSSCSPTACATSGCRWPQLRACCGTSRAAPSRR